eukprot:14244851-Alexandrium_andersonii.AAC.1
MALRARSVAVIMLSACAWASKARGCCSRPTLAMGARSFGAASATAFSRSSRTMGRPRWT